jgi:hypothetical protein
MNVIISIITVDKARGSEKGEREREREREQETVVDM